jgi:hypothetical protein
MAETFFPSHPIPPTVALTFARFGKLRPKHAQDQQLVKYVAAEDADSLYSALFAAKILVEFVQLLAHPSQITILALPHRPIETLFITLDFEEIGSARLIFAERFFGKHTIEPPQVSEFVNPISFAPITALAVVPWPCVTEGQFHRFRQALAVIGVPFGDQYDVPACGPTRPCGALVR